MLWLWALLLLAVLSGFVFLLKLAVTRMGGLVGRVTYERHTAAEGILATGRVPESWRKAAGGGGAEPASPSELRLYLHRLDELMRYFEHAPVFDEEPTRRLLLEELRAARSRWERGIWETPEGEPREAVPPA